MRCNQYLCWYQWDKKLGQQLTCDEECTCMTPNEPKNDVAYMCKGLPTCVNQWEWSELVSPNMSYGSILMVY